MKRLWSVLRLTNEATNENVNLGEYKIVVCETQNDEIEVLELARRRGLTVHNVVAPEDAESITLNDFE